MAHLETVLHVRIFAHVDHLYHHKLENRSPQGSFRHSKSLKMPPSCRVPELPSSSSPLFNLLFKAIVLVGLRIPDHPLYQNVTQNVWNITVAVTGPLLCTSFSLCGAQVLLSLYTYIEANEHSGFSALV